MKKYSAYKDSGIEWIGEIPENWIVRRLKYFARIRNGKDQKEILEENGPYPVYGSGGVFGRGSEYLYDKPSVLLGRKGTIDKPLFVDEPFWSVDTMYYTEISKDTDPKFFFYLVITIKFDYYQYGSAVPSMTQQDLNEIHFQCPPLEEQTTIANYLDHKTTEIDTLIEKKKQLIALYKEERTATINHAVTNNDNWECVPIKYMLMSGMIEQQDGNHGEIHPVASEFVGDGIPFVMANHLSNGKVDIENCKFITEERSKALRIGFAKEGDVLLTHKGTLGRTAIVQSVSTEYIVLTPQVTYYRCLKGLNNKFLKLYFDSEQFQNQLKFIGSEGTTRAYVGLLAQRDLKIEFPKDIEEQTSIVSESEKITNQLDFSISNTEKEIELLQEYKTALISEVVLGKVDVREEKLS